MAGTGLGGTSIWYNGIVLVTVLINFLRLTADGDSAMGVRKLVVLRSGNIYDAQSLTHSLTMRER